MPPAELCVVGDADQSIYAFRGATIRNILRVRAGLPATPRTILLEQNYRSTQTILSAANAVIARNTGRQPKNLWTDAGDGEQIVGYVADNEHDEAAFVAERDRPRWSTRATSSPSDVAVFYRTNAPVPGVRGGLHPGRPALQGRRRGALLRAQGGPRRAGLPAGRWPTRRHVSACAGSSTCPSAASATGPRRASRTSPTASGSRSPRRCAGAREVGELATRSLKAIQEFVALLEEFAQLVETGSGPAALLEASSTAPATSPSCRPAPTRRTRAGVENLRS